MCGPPHRTTRSGLGSAAAAPGSTAPNLLAVDPSAPGVRCESSTSWSPKKRLTGRSQFLHRADSAEPTRLPWIAPVEGHVIGAEHGAHDYHDERTLHETTHHHPGRCS